MGELHSALEAQREGQKKDNELLHGMVAALTENARNDVNRLLEVFREECSEHCVVVCKDTISETFDRERTAREQDKHELGMQIKQLEERINTKPCISTFDASICSTDTSQQHIREIEKLLGPDNNDAVTISSN